MTSRIMTSRAKICAAIVAGAWIALPAAAPAQVPGSGPVAAPSETVNLTMEQKHVIKEIIIKDMKAPTASAHVAAEPGKVVPKEVRLQPMPVEVSAKVPQVRTHSYFVEGDKVIIVDPKDNKISTVVE